jgi:hypothetical protein
MYNGLTDIVFIMSSKIKNELYPKARILYAELGNPKKKGKIISTKRFQTVEKRNQKKSKTNDTDINYFVTQRNDTA